MRRVGKVDVADGRVDAAAGIGRRVPGTFPGRRLVFGVAAGSGRASERPFADPSRDPKCSDLNLKLSATRLTPGA